MHKTRINRMFTLAGVAPAGKLTHTYCGLPPLLDLFVATMGKLNAGRGRALF